MYVPTGMSPTRIQPVPVVPGPAACRIARPTAPIVIICGGGPPI